MARLAIAGQIATIHGAIMTAATVPVAADDLLVTNTGRTMLMIENTGAVPRTVEIEFARTVDGQVITKISQPIPAGETWVFGSYKVANYGRAMKVNVDHAELHVNVFQP